MERPEPASAPVANQISPELDQLFAPWNRMDAPGLVVGISHGEDVIFRKGFGMASLETAVANTPRTRMRIGSTSKHFTCLLALLLAEEGLLDIDRPLRSYLPELAGPGGDPTLRELMQHRGGGRCYLDLGYISHGINLSSPNAALRAQARQIGRNFPAGEAMVYNNSGYNLLSVVIAKAGGAPFEQLLRERLFEPLGMRDTASIPSDYEITPGIATMHVPSSNGGWRRGLFQAEHVLGEGAIVSTVDDMLCWMQHLRKRDRIGSAQSWDALTKPDPYPDGTAGSYALGLINAQYRGLAVLHHPGGVMGGSSSMMTFPAQALDIIIMSNGAAGADVVKLSHEVADVILRSQLATPDSKLATEQNEACLGDWWSPETGMVYTIHDERGALKLRICRNDVSGGGILEPGPDGVAVCPEFAIGRVVIDLKELQATRQLQIGFGGYLCSYRAVGPAGVPQAAFLGFVVGEYHSRDADARAVIRVETDGLKIIFSDMSGSFEAVLQQLARTVGLVEVDSVVGQPNAVLNFQGPDEGADRFLLNTVRTRQLLFERQTPVNSFQCRQAEPVLSKAQR